jgi:Toprim domain
MATCPACSEARRSSQKRRSKVLAVNLIEPEFAVYYCNHCEAKGFSYPERRSSVIDQEELRRRRDEAKRHAESEKQYRTRQAMGVWNAATPFRGSLAETYLHETRGIGDWLDTFAFLDQVFRFNPDCQFGDERLPCLVALVRDIKTDNPVAVHRTALTKDAQKIDRRSLGPVAGGAIKISPDFEVHSGLLIAEGIETVLSASKIFQFKPAWSVVDAGNLKKFPVLSGVECVTIAVDNDPAGKEAAAECTRRLLDAGTEVITARTNKANDFNDVVRNA